MTLSVVCCLLLSHCPSQYTVPSKIIQMASHSLNNPSILYFLETLGKIQFNEDDSSHNDPHQEGQDDQECPSSTGRFLMTIFPINTLCIIYFWKPEAKPSSMKMTFAIMILIRKDKEVWNALQVQESS